ncbi:MAG: poly(A) polymerase [Gammaproteobacteria bacterium]|jgi:poly(A) polymerase
MRSQPPRIYSRGEHSVSRQYISEGALKVLYRLNNAGFKAYLVGGAVRDILLERLPKDFDIATNAHPEEIRELFRNSRLIGRRFRLAHVRFGREIIEVATFRAGHEGDEDGASINDGGRILRDNVYGQLDDDVWRRDFTINALYYDINDFSIVDYVGGVEDIAHRRLRLIGDPALRYREDPVRMLRAIRFASKLDFEIDDATREAFDRYGSLLNEIAPARLFDESLKMFHSGHGLKTFESLHETGLFEQLFPLAAQTFDPDPLSYNLVIESMRNTDQRLAEDKSVNPAFIFAAILWGALQARCSRLVADDVGEVEAFSIAADEVISEQVKRVAIPRRFTTVAREIWLFQSRLCQPSRKRADKLLEHARFRAAYDFLLLRGRAGEPLSDIGQWWTDLQDTDEPGRETMLAALQNPAKKRRRSRTRRRKPAD